MPSFNAFLLSRSWTFRYSDTVFSPFSEANSKVQPGRKILSSQDIGWTSLLFERWSQPGLVEGFQTVGSPDQTVVLTASGTYGIEVLSSGQWRRATYGLGDGGATAPWNTNQIRWRATGSAPIETLHLYIPSEFFAEAAEEYRRAGRPARLMEVDALHLSDPFAFSVAQSLALGVAQSSPNLHAEAAARILSIHLLLASGALREGDLTRSPGAELTDRRLARVIDFMRHHFARPITLDELANIAGISRFHFARLFRRRVQKTPHQYLIDCRLEHSKLLLRTTDLDITAVALACGFHHAGRFAKAFHAAFALRPSEFRTQCLQSSR